MNSVRRGLRLWLFWSGLTSLTFIVNSSLGWLLQDPHPSPWWDTLIRAVPWTTRNLLSPAPGHQEGPGSRSVWGRAALAGIVWIFTPPVIGALWPDILFFPGGGPGEAQWWWLAGGLSLAISHRSALAGLVGALALFGYQSGAHYIVDLPHMLDIPNDLMSHLVWLNLLYGTLVGTVVTLSEAVYVFLRGILSRTGDDLDDSEATFNR